MDLSVANQMLLKHRAKLETAQSVMNGAKAKLEAEQETARETKAEVDQLLSWADCYEAADISTKHVIVARLIERIDITSGYKVHIKFRISMKQFLGQA